jgi:hypothetical protein
MASEPSVGFLSMLIAELGFSEYAYLTQFFILVIMSSSWHGWF